MAHSQLGVMRSSVVDQCLCSISVTPPPETGCFSMPVRGRSVRGENSGKPLTHWVRSRSKGD